MAFSWLINGVILTTYDTWDDPPRSSCSSAVLATHRSEDNILQARQVVGILVSFLQFFEMLLKRIRSM